MVGNQKVNNLNSKTPAMACPSGTPKAVRPIASAASVAPNPPGVGLAEATALPAKYINSKVVNEMAEPKASKEPYKAKV